MKTLEQSIKLGDAGQIGAVAMQNGYKTEHIKGVQQIFFDSRLMEFSGSNMFIMEKEDFFFRATANMHSVWGLHKSNGQITVPDMKDAMYTIKEVIFLEKPKVTIGSGSWQSNLGMRG